MTQTILPGFDDGKEPDALRTIGEVAAALGIRPHVLRYWEEQFPTLRPVKRSGGRRYYRPEDIELIVTIDRLVHREGFTLKGARKAISGSGPSGRGASPQTPATGDSGDELVPGLRALRDRLARALARA